MAFNFSKNLTLGSISLLFLTACTPGTGLVLPDHKAENLIGVPLSQNSKLQSSTDEDSDKVVVFDKTIKKVHHFDLETSKHLGLFDIEQPEEEHYLIYSSSKDYYIDLSKKQINIQMINGEKNLSTKKFVGTPISASYDSQQGYLVVYDNYQSVIIFKIDEKGRLLKQFISGPVVGADGTIQAGDIAGNGQLVLSVRGNPQKNTGTVEDYILLVDIEQTVAQPSSQSDLVYTRVNTTLTEMSWLAPIPGSPNLVLVRSKDKISLIDLTSGSMTSQPMEGWVVEKYSKIKDPHIVLRKTYDYNSTLNGNAERRIFYVDGGVLKTKALTKNFSFITNSHLDVKKGQWNVTKANIAKEYDLFNSYNNPKFQERSFTRLRLNDLLSVIDISIDNSATVDMAGDYLFSLFPSKMGYATKTEIESNKTTLIRNFNIKYLK